MYLVLSAALQLTKANFVFISLTDLFKQTRSCEGRSTHDLWCGGYIRASSSNTRLIFCMDWCLYLVDSFTLTLLLTLTLFKKKPLKIISFSPCLGQDCLTVSFDSVNPEFSTVSSYLLLCRNIGHLDDCYYYHLK